MNKFVKQVLLLSVGLGCCSVLAKDLVKSPEFDLYVQECASCHMAYPGKLLPVASWQRIMGKLDKHFGVDASLDTLSQHKIQAWLLNNAATGSQFKKEPPNDRITLSSWFLRKHNKNEVSPSVWKRASIGSSSNCIACHAEAAKGDFEENKVRIPK